MFKKLLLPVAIAGFLFVWSSQIAFAGYTDGNEANWLNNGHLTSDLSYWSLAGTYAWQPDNDGRVALYRDPSAASIIQTVDNVPAGLVSLEYRYYSGYNGGIRINIYKDGSSYNTTCFSTGTSWQVGTCSFVIDSVSSIGVEFKKITGGLGNNSVAYLDYVIMKVDGEGPQIEQPNPTSAVNPRTAVCLVDTTGNYTAPITGTESITATNSVTVSANLLTNYGFEQGDIVPDNWKITPGLYAPSLYSNDENGRYLYHNELPAVEIEQALILPSLPPGYTYLFGVYARHESVRPFTVHLGATGNLEINPTAVTADFVRHESQHITSGLQNFTVKLPDSSGLDQTGISIDDVFIVPVQDDGNGGIAVYCGGVKKFHEGGSSEEYAPVGNPFGLPVPVNGAGTVCYDCYFPQNRGVEAAIAWLGCVLRNLFSCSLRHWLNELANISLGIFGSLSAVLNFFALNGQAAVNWTAGLVEQLAATAVAGYNQIALFLSAAPLTIQITISEASSGLSWGQFLLELLLGIVRLFFDLVLGLVNGLLGFLNLIWEIVTAVWMGVSAEPLKLDEFLAIQNGATAADVNTADALTATGYTDSKVILWFMWSLATVDAMFIDSGAFWLVWVAAGAVGVIAFLWIMQQFKDGIMPSV